MKIKSYKSDEIEPCREASKITATILDELNNIIKEDISTSEIDDYCLTRIQELGGTPAPLFYRGFPKSTCTSLNHVICHGIPGEKILLNGDILNIDITVILDGWHGDTSRMFWVGKPSIKAIKLIETTFEAMWRGRKFVKPGATLGDIGFAIQNFAEKKGYSVVRDFCGHGIGRVFHDSPSVLHYGNKNEGIKLKEGMFFTIEPMINVGKFDVKILSDGWTAVTRDKSLSAQFEHTICVTSSGYEVFTLSPKNLNYPPFNL